MPTFASPRRVAAALGLVALASVLSCGRDLTGPNARIPATIAFAPRFVMAGDAPLTADASTVASLVPFDRVRIVLRREGAEVRSQLVNFPSSADSVALQVTVPISAAAATEGEPFEALLRYINAQGDTVFAGGPFVVFARAGSGGGTAVEIPVTHVGPGSSAVSINVSPDSIAGNTGTSINLSAVALNAQQQPVANAVIGFISRNPALVSIPNLAVGTAQLVGVRGSTWVVAQLISGAADSTFVTINPVPTSLTKVSGDLQSTLGGAPFSAPLRVRVTAADGLGLKDWPVTFSVASGGGSVSQTTAPTDADGFAEVSWIAGTAVGSASVTASIASPALSVTFTGTQASPDPTSLAFTAQPTGIVAGSVMPPVTVEVKNGLGQLMTGFTGNVVITLTGGTVQSELLGTDTVAAVGGVATFSDLSVNRAGTTYRLEARVPGAPVATSAVFAVTAAPPTAISLVSGGSQSAPPSTQLAQPIVVRVTDQFGFDVAGAQVNVSVAAGGGTVQSSTLTTATDGTASVLWTLGATGTQVLQFNVGQAAPLQVSATVVGQVQGGIELFAGLDSIQIAKGQTGLIPVYLSAPAPTNTSVLLSTSGTLGAWTTDSIVIPAGQVRADAFFRVTEFGAPATVFLTSALGTDSVTVTAFEPIVTLPQYDFYFKLTPGDTIYTMVFLSTPAQAGGVNVTVTSSDATAILVAEADGAGPTFPGCVASYCGLARADTGSFNPRAANLVTGTAASSVVVNIPEGQLSAPIAFVVPVTAQNTANVEVAVSAIDFRASQRLLSVEAALPLLFVQGSSFSSSIGVDQRGRARFELSTGVPLRDRVVKVVSLEPSIATVSDTLLTLTALAYTSPDFSLRGVSPGTTAIAFGLDGVLTDTIPVTIGGRRLQLQGFSSQILGMDKTAEVRLTSDDGTLWESAADVAISLRSTNTDVIALTKGGLTMNAGEYTTNFGYRIVGTGSAYIVAEAPGIAADSLFISPSNTVLVLSGNNVVGVGLTHEMELEPSVPGRYATTTATVTSVSPSIVRVLTPTLNFSTSAPPSIRVEGLAEGIGAVAISAPGFAPSQLQFIVVPGAVTFPFSNVYRRIDSTVVEPLALTYLSAQGSSAAPADTLFGILRTSNAAVAEIVDSIVVFAPGGNGVAASGSYRVVGEGTASLTVDVPGFSSGTMSVVGSRPRLLKDVWSGSRVAVGTTLWLDLYRESAVDSPLAVSVTQSGPGAVNVVPASIQFPIGSEMTTLQLEGTAVGIDTVVFSAAGLVPDTLILDVQSDYRLYPLLQTYVAAGTVDSLVSVFVEASGADGFSLPSGARRFSIRSLDTLVAVVERDTVRYSGVFPLPTTYGVIRYRDSGSARLVFTDIDGSATPDTISVNVQAPTLSGYTSYDNTEFAIGMGQRAYDGEVEIWREAFSSLPLWVRIEQSNPGLVQVPDSIEIKANETTAIVPLAALDTTGSVRLRFSAPGYNPWELNVFVTESRFDVYFETAVVGHRPFGEVALLDALTEYVRPLRAPVPVRYRSDQAGVIDTAGTSFLLENASSYYTDITGPTALASGTAFVWLEDARVGAVDRIRAAGQNLFISTGSISPSAAYRELTPGLRSSGGLQQAFVSTHAGSSTFTFTSRDGRFAPTLPSITRTFSNSNDQELFFELDGITAGDDALIISAPNYRADTIAVKIQPGTFLVDQMPSSRIAVGDSIRITLRFADPTGASALSTSVQTISFSPDTTLVVSDGSAPISSLDVPANSTTFSFWVRKLTSADGELSIGGPNFRTLRIPLAAR